MLYEKEKEIAIKSVTMVAQLCKQIQKKQVVGSSCKRDYSPVTIADFVSQAVICCNLSKYFPSDPIVGEEDSSILRELSANLLLSEITLYSQLVFPSATDSLVLDWIDLGNKKIAKRYWTLDPIDGTKGFLRKEQYAIALALVEDGEVKVAVLACPALQIDLAPLHNKVGVIFTAVQEQGATVVPLGSSESIPIPIKVSALDDSFALRTVESFEAAHSDQSKQEKVAKLTGSGGISLQKIDSQVKYGIVASGMAELYLRLPPVKNRDYKENIWDHAAGSLILEESGGCVTDMHGKKLDFSASSKLIYNQGIVASNSIIHGKVLEILKEMI